MEAAAGITAHANQRIVFTGGSGKAGRHVISYLIQHGYEVLNLDLMPLPSDISNVHTIKTDLTQSGQVFNGISSHFKLTQPFREPLLRPPDAVVHFGAYARNMIVPDDETFRVNVLATYNVIEAACKLGVKKIIVASSIATYGVTFAEGDVDYLSFPIEEILNVEPMDTYAISKLCGEIVARGFARRFGVDIYMLRLGNIIAPEEHEAAFRAYVEEPGAWKGHGWSYIDVRDLGQMCDLCVKKDGLGFQIFNATNDEITNANPTEEFLKKECPRTLFTREMGKHEAPVSNRKAKELLGFKEKHGWRSAYITTGAPKMSNAN
ncbi:uncharacterized protein Z518_07038 [Rhinocladiella mackenziei CBS 650.93]|uniref:NAD-dependent epimerase/dehydratase domain-containing protein n=1 Tax=Rhinocladiella mackenziei CBS 650.93 TaxID=1442369 RepID=A0A0D2J3G3_9EURO|nr:uncharacterized protein Z518_07038 [Rhinocladiella mackenziei CBS 650.93]KIX03485.1 hypothetical protein Z518_07038 [Rhinocladiella mackenziei CBS 650.93]